MRMSIGYLEPLVSKELMHAMRAYVYDRHWLQEKKWHGAQKAFKETMPTDATITGEGIDDDLTMMTQLVNRYTTILPIHEIVHDVGILGIR